MPYVSLIQKIAILQHGECRYLGSHPCKEARKLLIIIVYNHELVIQLRKDSLNSISEMLKDQVNGVQFFWISLYGTSREEVVLYVETDFLSRLLDFLQISCKSSEFLPINSYSSSATLT